MDYEVELAVRTNIYWFESWLEDWKMRILPYRSDLGDGKYMDVTEGPIVEGIERGSRRHIVRTAIKINHPKIEEPELNENWISPVIEFEVLELSDNRIIVKARCTLKEILPYFVDMLDVIAWR